MIYKELPKFNPEDIQIYARIDEDGLCRLTCTSEDHEFVAWLEEGNTPLSAPTEELTWDTIRTKRDQLIRESDWTMVQDASVDQAQWAAYRQILRDLPQTYTNPEDVVWPTEPSTSGPNTNS